MNYNFDEIINRENTNSVKYDLRKQMFGKEDVMPMWVADMDFATPSFIRDAIIKRAQHPVYGYTVRMEEFPDSIISWMKRRHNWEINSDWISFSPGIVPALNLSVLAYTEPGDKVLIQPPVYFPFFRAIRDHQREVVMNELVNENGAYKINFEDFEEKASKSEIFIFCHPHNPVGRSWDEHELTKIVAICRKYNTLIISDEIHSDLILDNKKHIPLLTIPGADEITASMYAPSKTFNLAGLSTSFLIIPDEKVRKKFDKIVDNLHLGLGNIFGAEALVSAYNEGEEWLEELLEYLRENISFMSDFFSKRIPEIKVIVPEATYLTWLDFRALEMKDDEIKSFVIEKAGLGLNHGPVFGPGGEGFQRINIATPKQYLELALVKLEKAVADYRSSINP